MIYRIKQLVLLLISFSLFTFVKAQESRDYKLKQADSILLSRGEVVFSFDEAYLNTNLYRILSIDQVTDGKAVAYANKKGFSKFAESGIPFELLPANFKRTRLKQAQLAAIDAIYPSYEAYVARMTQFASDYPTLCKLVEIGQTLEGRKLLALKISKNVNRDEPEPAVFYTSSIHGDELTGFILMLKLADYLLKNYNSNSLVTRLIDGTEIWINPLANPDGAYYGGNSTVAFATRFNANTLDLNRNFPDPADGLHPDGAPWQPETQAMMAFYKEHKIKLSVNFHTGQEVVNYPWDTWSRLHADNDWYKHISRQYADLAHQKSAAYMTVFDNGIVDGYTWYRVTGGRQDYVNYFLQGREVTIELSKDGFPDSTTLEKYWNYNRESMLHYMEQSLFGLHGIVTDAETGLPIKATIELLNYDKDNSYIYSDSTNGTYYRYLAAGNYSIEFSAKGYETYSAAVTILDDQASLLNVKLTKDRTIETSDIYPNPFTNELNLQVDPTLPPESKFEIEVYDVTGKMVYQTFATPKSNNRLKIAIPGLHKGLFIIKVKWAKGSRVFKVVKQ